MSGLWEIRLSLDKTKQAQLMRLSDKYKQYKSSRVSVSNIKYRESIGYNHLHSVHKEVDGQDERKEERAREETNKLR